MVRRDRQSLAPGVSVLGGAGGGLSYEGMMRDAVATEERSRRQEAGRSRALPRIQVQAPQPEPPSVEQIRAAGR